MKHKFLVTTIALSALAGFSVSASASSILLLGSSYNSVTTFPGYGAGAGNRNLNNVVNSGLSGVTDADPLGGDWVTSDGNSAAGVAFVGEGVWRIDYYHIGAESGNTNRLTVGGSNPFTHDEKDENNNITNVNEGPYHIGTTYETVGAPYDPDDAGFVPQFLTFSVEDLDVAGSSANGSSAKPGQSVPSLMYAYVKKTAADTWEVTDEETSWFAFGFDDPGSTNDNHDDYMGIAQVRFSPGGIEPIPIPAPFALLLTGLLGLGFLGRWRGKSA